MKELELEKELRRWKSKAAQLMGAAGVRWRPGCEWCGSVGVAAGRENCHARPLPINWEVFLMGTSSMCTCDCHNRHPDAELLELASLGFLPLALGEDVSDHVLKCGKCRRAVAALRDS